MQTNIEMKKKQTYDWPNEQTKEVFVMLTPTPFDVFSTKSIRSVIYRSCDFHWLVEHEQSNDNIETTLLHSSMIRWKAASKPL
jgi:hypothetical protein